MHFPPKILHFLRYTYEIPIFSAQRDLTQLDHNPEVTLDTFGISSRWSFGCLAGRFGIPIAQSGPFWPKNAVLGPKSIFSPTRSLFGSKNWPKNQIFLRFTSITYLFCSSIMIIVLYLTVLHGIGLLALARKTPMYFIIYNMN